MFYNKLRIAIDCSVEWWQFGDKAVDPVYGVIFEDAEMELLKSKKPVKKFSLIRADKERIYNLKITPCKGKTCFIGRQVHKYNHPTSVALCRAGFTDIGMYSPFVGRNRDAVIFARHNDTIWTHRFIPIFEIRTTLDTNPK